MEGVQADAVAPPPGSSSHNLLLLVKYRELRAILLTLLSGGTLFCFIISNP